DWKKCAATEIMYPLNPKYKPDVCHWVCTCPSFASSQFPICKHLVQMVEDILQVFFYE
ncbi:hypothetical protein GYMLUDRAFT_107178, partial [Collybiopsis luxurians FD-317 M1]